MRSGVQAADIEFLRKIESASRMDKVSCTEV